MWGSWLQGPGAVLDASAPAGSYAGARLGLPPRGPGSLAGVGRRLAAVSVDWVASLAIAGGLLRPSPASLGWVTLAVFAAAYVLLDGTLGTTVGQRLLGLRVEALGRRPAGLVRALVRTLLLCLVFPALFWDRDGRGLHDQAAGTVLVRR